MLDLGGGGGGGGGAAGLDMLQFIASNCEVDCMDFSK